MSATPQSPTGIGNDRYLTGTNFETSITALAGGGQTGATAITAQMSRIDTVATAADSVALPKVQPFAPGDARPGATGQLVFIYNAGANSCQVFGATPDTVNGVATATGVPLPTKSWMIAWPVAYVQSTNVGSWNAMIAQDVLGSGIAQVTAPAGFANFRGGSVTDGTDTFFASGTLFVTSVFLPVNKTLTGIGYLLGSVGGTDKVIVQLNSAAGALLANSTLTGGGTTAGTTAQTQQIAFTSTYNAIGPAMYYIGVAADGGTAKLLTVPAYRAPELFANSLTQTVHVPAAITPPTTFTADKAPIAYLY